MKNLLKYIEKSTLKDLVGVVLGKDVTEEMQKKCKHIFPLENVTIRKVKSIKRPKVDIAQLSAMQADSKLAGNEVAKKEEREEK